MQENSAPVDPVSGNEIPPGSLPEEVRDDIDAKLSEGEYVVPADVLRYFGVKFFEDLRTQAKGDLSKMDQEGRIGGEPMAGGTAGAEEELSPQEMAMLEELTASGPQEFDEGGTVAGIDTVMFNPDSWGTVGSTYGSNDTIGSATGSGSYYKTYRGPNGEYQMILFVNGEPVTAVPEGFTAVESSADQVTEEGAVDPLGEAPEGPVNDIADSFNENDSQAGNSWAEENREALESDPIGFGLAAAETGSLGKVGVAAATVFGGMGLGGVANVATQGYNIAEMRAAQREAEAQGLDTTPLDTKISEAINNLPVGVKTLTESGKLFSGLNFTSSINSSKKTVDTTATGGNQESTLAPTTSARPQARPSSSTSDGSSSGSSSTEASSDTYGEDRNGGMNKGGLASKKTSETPKRKKTRAKGKGLATKK